MKRSIIINTVFAAGIAFMALQFTGCAGMALSSGEKAYHEGDYEAAAAYFQEAANEGIPQAQYRLAWLYRSGKGVPREQAAFDRLIQQAADNGHAQAQTFLGMRYYKGLRVAPDYARAKAYFESAAEQQDGLALFFLGEMYASGAGVEKNPGKAHAYLLKARITGVPVSESLLAETGMAFRQ